MAAKTPTAATTAGDPRLVVPVRNAQTSGGHDAIDYADRLKHEVFYFDDIDDTNTWTSPFAGDPDGSSGSFMKIRGWAFSPLSAGSLIVNCDPATGIFTFTTSAANQNGYLHVWLAGQ